MKIYGVRIYPKSVRMIQGKGALIFLHGRVNNNISDFFYIFGPTAPLWYGYFFVHPFGISIEPQGKIEDPLPDLLEEYGESLVDMDVKSQLLLLSGDHFRKWAISLYATQGALLPILREVVPFDSLKRLYWDETLPLQSD